MTDVDVRRPVPAWIWGGALLVATAVVPSLAGAGGPLREAGAAISWVSLVSFAAAMVVFAWGIRGEGSVVARRPLGIVALCLVGIILPVVGLISSFVFVVDPADPSATPSWIGAAQVVNYAGYAAWGGAALVAGVEVARARVVPGRWRWAPLTALGVLALAFVGMQIVSVAVATSPDPTATFALIAVWGAVSVLVPLALGGIALVLGARGRPAPATQVYPPAR
ncbi:hypothetical protein [Microbacterium dextranolyticum]|uniref:Uncharacterized protein n=1 Tax=Microbacterium dextranolyticum TaxID=36806 RepID=A0A9W6HKG8_9MICO|nr:hypothetical protein [Microbacterium dextranolyticum]MBM7463844.1 hypothetical protein [Microbacterium dextranolyticum]GLJ94925.1 hypothetical protein GCM10017591_09870 [Microbacterium dextranolyticum]